MMNNYFKRLKDHPGVGIATMMTILGALAGGTNKSFPWHIGMLLGLIFCGGITWTFVLLSNIERKPKQKLIETPIESAESKTEEWSPVPGYEKYYIQNSDGKIKSIGNEFDFNIENGCSEEKAAWLTMKFLKGYYSKDPIQNHNIEKVIEVMDKKWKITSKNDA